MSPAQLKETLPGGYLGVSAPIGIARVQLVRRTRWEGVARYHRFVARIAWIVFTMGDRPTKLAAAVESLLAQMATAQVNVFANRVDPVRVEPSLTTLSSSSLQQVDFAASDTNLGAPGGRVAAIHHVDEAVDACS